MNLTASEWPWQWTYALFLEKRWEQVQEISSLYGDDELPDGNDFKEIPKEYWHDRKRVDEWTEAAKQRKKDKTAGAGG